MMFSALPDLTRRFRSRKDKKRNGIIIYVRRGDFLKAYIEDNTEQYDKYLELSCNLSELEKIKKCIFELQIDNGIKKKIFLACDEIFSNITSYSGAERVQFRCIRNTDKVTVTFTDNGIFFNPLESKVEKDFEDFDLGGMGISLVKELCSGINYNNIHGENILSLEFTV